MSHIKVFADSDPTTAIHDTSDQAKIAEILGEIGVRFEQWEATVEIAAGAEQDAVIAAYKADIDRLIAENGYQTVDVVSIAPDNPKKGEFRAKFIDEHTHTEDEVRFFVGGQGLFTMHARGNVYEVLCTKNDLISVPANTPHWFDMGPNPDFTCIRLFDDPSGWVANYTGEEISTKFSRLAN